MLEDSYYVDCYVPAYVQLSPIWQVIHSMNLFATSVVRDHKSNDDYDIGFWKLHTSSYSFLLFLKSFAIVPS